MLRIPQRLFEQPFDVTVVGGGVYGAMIALAASRHGYKVALVEKGDFNSGTSANSLKILHGGLRYLQHMDLGRMRRSIRSRNFFLQYFPHLIDNVPFLIPLHGYGMKGPLVLGAGLLFNELVSLDRNRRIDKDSRIGSGRLISRRKVERLLAGITPSGCNGGAVWVESVVNDTERLVLELIKMAANLGATAANYLRASALLETAGNIEGVSCRDLISGEEGTIRAGMVVDASGPAVGRLGRSLPGYPATKRRHIRAVNLILKNDLFGNTAVGLPYRDRVRDNASLATGRERQLFFVPLNGHTMVGTFYDLEEHTEQGLTLSHSEKESFLGTVSNLLPGQPLTRDDVCRWHSGWLPLAAATAAGSIEPAKSSNLRTWLGKNGTTGLLEVTAAKFTTAPVVAEKVVAKLSSIISTPAGRRPAYRTQVIAEPGKDPFAQRLRRRYGTEWPTVQTATEQDPATKHIIAGDTTVSEVMYALRHEMACHLADVVIRRTAMAACGLPPTRQVEAVAQLMAPEMGWDQTDIEREIADLQQQYEPGGTDAPRFGSRQPSVD